MQHRTSLTRKEPRQCLSRSEEFEGMVSLRKFSTRITQLELEMVGKSFGMFTFLH